MRLVKVAKALGMTGQELRHELSKVEFGIKPADREVPDNLAHGIVRYIARVKGIAPDLVALGADDGAVEGVEEGEGPAEPAAPAAEAPREEAVPSPDKGGGKEGGGVPATGTLGVLRKLTLEGVPAAAIRAAEKQIAAEGGGAAKLSKKEIEERRLEEKAMRGGTALATGPESHQVQIKRKEGLVMLPAALTVKEFAEKAGIQVPKVVQALMSSGVMATVNQTIDYETAAIVADELGVKVQKQEAEISAADLLARNLEELIADEPEHLRTRPPVVVVMGHVDHGKTAILDAIRETNVAQGEAGGITQHIGAYQVEHTPRGSGESRMITFLDTPGHEAFTSMRARGAQVTDIAVIVVSAEDGVMPTTREAISHAKDAGVPVIVAINKIDKEHADPDRVKGELAGVDLQPEEWGGKTPVVLCSALTKQGIPDLLDAIVLQADISVFKANPDRSAVATVIESRLHPSLGPLATVLVNAGTLRRGDAFVCGTSVGKIRTMTDAHGKPEENVPPSGAVRIAGFDAVPKVGDILQVVASEKLARELREQLCEQKDRLQKRSFADLVSRLSQGKLKQLNVVLKADAQGSMDALHDALLKLGTDQTSVKIIHQAIGAVSESDVSLAAAGEGIVLAFGVPVPTDVKQTAKRQGAEIRQYDVIYTLLGDVDGLLKGLVEPEESEKVVGRLDVLAVFLTKKKEQIVGGKVRIGSVKRLPFRILRGDGSAVAGTGKILSLKHQDKDIREAKEGSECGLRVEATEPVQVGDTLEVFVQELRKKE